MKLLNNLVRFAHRHKLLTVLLCTIIVSGFIFIPYLIMNKPFVLGWDYRNTYGLFYDNVNEMLSISLSEKVLPFYSWNLFLGNNFWASKLFFYSDIFEWIATIATDVHFYIVTMVLSCIKLCIASSTFYFYIRKKNYKLHTIILGCLLFAFSAWSIDSMKDPFFLSFYIFIPFYFLGIDEYIANHKKIMYIIITAFLAMTNYYNFFTISMFSTIYFLYRYYQVNNSFKGVVKSTLVLIIYYFIGVLVVGFALVPCFLDIIQNSRIAQNSFGLFYASPRTYFSILSGMFLPTTMTGNGGPYIESLFYYVTPTKTDLKIYLWAGSIISILIFQPFIQACKRKANIIFYIILMLLLFIPLGSSAMHGFSESSFRWTFLIIFMNLILILPYVNDLDLINRKVLVINLIVCIAIILFTQPLLAFITGVNFTKYLKEYFLLIWVIVIIGILFVIIYKRIKHAKIWITMITIAELCFVVYMSFYGNPFFSEITWDVVIQSESTLKDKETLNKFLFNLDPNNEIQFYRVYVPRTEVYWDYSPNLNLKYQIPGLMTYDSTFSPASNDINLIHDSTKAFPWNIEIEEPSLVDFFGGKYAIVTEESQLPHKNYEMKSMYNDYYYVYENLNYTSFTKSFDQVITYDDYMKVNNPALINETVIAHKKDFVSISNLVNDATFEELYVTKDLNKMNIGLMTTKDTFVVIPIPFDKGWQIIVNGVKAETYQVNGGTIGLSVPAGTVDIQMFFIPYGLKIGLMLSVLCVVLLSGIVILELIDKKSRFHNKQIISDNTENNEYRQ